MNQDATRSPKTAPPPDGEADRGQLLASLQAALAGDDTDADDGPARIINDLPAATLADLLESLSEAPRERLWRWIGNARRRGEVLAEVHRDVRKRLIELSSDNDLVEAVQGLDLDALSDIVGDLPNAVTREVLERMPAARRSRFEVLRGFAHDSAGGLMDIDAVNVPQDLTLDGARAALARLRAERGGLPAHLDALVVVDDQQSYRGQLMLTDLLSLDPRTPVADALRTDRPAVPADMPAAKVARLFEDADLVSAPVLDAADRVIGRITVDDVVDVVRGEAEQSLMAQSGLSKDEDTFAPAWRSARRRAVWLGINLCSALVAATVIGTFEAAIEQLVALAVLMPVVASMGGVAGTQSLAVVIRGLALSQVQPGNRLQLVRKELTVGAINGLLWAAVLALVATLWFGRPVLGAVAALAIVLNLLLGVGFGTLIPMLLARLHIDPALAGTVLLVAVTDALGFLLFLGLATLILL